MLDMTDLLLTKQWDAVRSRRDFGIPAISTLCPEESDGFVYDGG
jgi:hypothetical protein